jgi:hypothetical protein
VSRARTVFAFAIVIVAGMALGLVFSTRTPEPLPKRAPSERPTLLLLTSLPLVFSEQFSLKNNGSPVLQRLELRYQVVPISVTDPGELRKGRLLFMAQPLAQPAEDLVALDQWVRAGGRVLLAADPALEWPDERPLGDPLNPPAMFMDTGLLAHWGLQLDSPEESGERLERLGSYEILTDSPGRLAGGCSINRDRLVAHCNVGNGRATIIADADFLDVERLGPKSVHNLDALIEELARLELK